MTAERPLPLFAAAHRKRRIHAAIVQRGHTSCVLAYSLSCLYRHHVAVCLTRRFSPAARGRPGSVFFSLLQRRSRPNALRPDPPATSCTMSTVTSLVCSVNAVSIRKLHRMFTGRGPLYCRHKQRQWPRGKFHGVPVAGDRKPVKNIFLGFCSREGER